METIYETKAEIVKGTSKKGNAFYGMKVYINKDYANFTILQNADLELVKQIEKSLMTDNKENV